MTPRPAGPDPLGLRRVLGDRLLPVLIGAMAFLAALALGGALAAQALADRWRLGAGTALTAMVPRPDDPAASSPGAASASRLDRVLALLRGGERIVEARPLAAEELRALLRPWLGEGDVPESLLPAVIAVHAAPDATPADLAELARKLSEAAPGASLEDHAAWVGRLAVTLRGLEACGWGALTLVGAVAALVVGAATRAGLVARRATVDILHGLGATDGYVATRFARRATGLAALGGVAGILFAAPVLLGLAWLARPFGDPPRLDPGGFLALLPPPLWAGLAALPLIAAAIGFFTAQATVRLWLRRLP